MATKSKEATASEKKLGPISSAWETAWNGLAPIRSTWDEKEQALMAQTNDTVSGQTTASRVSDGALSTLAYERQARVTAQLPTGRIYALNKKDDDAARLLNIAVTRYIIPNANSQFDMLIKLRLWGVYASVYGSMPMMYDYRVDDEYIGPDCYLIDPRCFAPVSGASSVQEAGCYISTIMTKSQLEGILERKTTSYNKAAVKKLLKLIESKKSKPSKDSDSAKTNTTVGQRYDLSNAHDRVEIVTKYTHKTWVSFAPDFCDVSEGEDLIIRTMDNPHKSGRIPVVMRHCFPLLNSVFGLGDYERGMKVQKAKDSILNLFLEGAKMRVFPPLKMIDNQLTPSTIRYQAGVKWKVKNMDAVQAHSSGPAPLNEFQATYAALSGIQQNMFGTSTTEISQEQGGPMMGKTPEALKMQSSRENARDSWDRFMGEKATEELIEGMANLLHVKMEKPINFNVEEDDIQALGYKAEGVDQMTGEQTQEEPVEGLEVFDGAKVGKLSLSKKMLHVDSFVRYVIDSSSTMKQDAEEQFAALMATWNLAHQDPALQMRLMEQGFEYDEADHFKKIMVAAGINDWEKTLKEISPEKMAQIQQAKQQAEQQAAMQPQVDPMQQMMAQMGGMPPQGQPQMPMDPNMQQQPQSVPMGPQMGQMPPFEDPEVAQIAQMMMGGMQ